MLSGPGENEACPCPVRSPHPPAGVVVGWWQWVRQPSRSGHGGESGGPGTQLPNCSVHLTKLVMRTKLQQLVVFGRGPKTRQKSEEG